MSKFVVLTKVTEGSKYSELPVNTGEHSVLHAVKDTRYLRPVCLNTDFIIKIREDLHLKDALKEGQLGLLGEELDKRHEFTKVYLSGGNSSIKSITVIGNMEQIINKIQETDNEFN